MLPADPSLAAAPDPSGNGPVIRLREGRPPSDLAHDAKRARLLLIDDCIFDHSPEVVALRLAGFDVTVVQTGEAGLLLLERETFELIVQDLVMPGMSGIEVLAEVSRRQYGIPVVVLTGFGSVAAATAAMKLGAADFLQKPIWLEDLVACAREARVRHLRGAMPVAPTEADLVRTRAALIPECVGCDEAATIVIRLLLDERISLRYVHGLAEAVRLLLKSTDPPTSAVLDRAQQLATEGLTAPWPTDPRLLKTLGELETSPRKQRQTAFARLVGWSRAHLSRRLTNATGHSPSKWCRVAVLRAALRHLMRTCDQVSEVADKVGYAHVSQFDREFRAVFLLPPRTVRSRFASLRNARSTRS